MGHMKFSSRNVVAPNLLSFLRRFRAMELNELYFGDFMQIDGLDAFPGVVVPDGIKLSIFEQKTLGHKVDSFGRLCPGTMKSLTQEKLSLIDKDIFLWYNGMIEIKELFT